MTLKLNLTRCRLARVKELANADHGDLETCFHREEWGADLATGLIELGEQARRFHEVDGPTCGIMSLIRLYDRSDWPKILRIFEDAAGGPTNFAFATTIRVAPGLFRPIFCVGESDSFNGTGGRIEGVFAIAHTCVQMQGEVPANLN